MKTISQKMIRNQLLGLEEVEGRGMIAFGNGKMADKQNIGDI